MDLNKIQNLQLKNFLNLKELIIQVSNFESLQFINLPRLELLKVQDELFFIHGGIEKAVLLRDKHSLQPTVTTMVSGPVLNAQVSSLPP